MVVGASELIAVLPSHEITKRNINLTRDMLAKTLHEQLKITLHESPEFGDMVI